MGGPFIPRTEEQLQSIPAHADAAVAVGSSIVASSTVAPFIMCVDKAVCSYTATRCSLFRSILTAASEFLHSPRVALSSPAVWMVSGVYGLTYAAANLSDLVSERQDADPHSAAAGKFLTTTAANMSCSVLKDAAFARMFGAAGPAATVPMASYMLFAGRDCFTIGGAFFVPETLAKSLSSEENPTMPEESAVMASQLITPVLMQSVCTPLHVLALQLVNTPVATFGERIGALLQAGPSVLVARALRMLPAYGIGGILNGSLQSNGREYVANKYCPHLEPETRPSDYKMLPVTFLYGPGVHPIMLAREWALLVGGEDIVQFIEENDEDGDGTLDIEEVEHLLEKRGLHEGARELVAFADEDGDGHVSAKDLKTVLLRRYSTSHSRKHVEHHKQEMEPAG